MSEEKFHEFIEEQQSLRSQQAEEQQQLNEANVGKAASGAVPLKGKKKVKVKIPKRKPIQLGKKK